MRSKRKLLSAILAWGTVAALTTTLAANGLNLNGIGSRAMGMSGAVISWTSDVSLFYFNPAGAAGAKSGWISLFETNLLPTGTYKFPAAGVDAQTMSKVYPAGAMGFVKPLSDKLFIGLGVFTPSGTGAKWNGDDLKNLVKGNSHEWESSLAVFSIAPLVAYKVTDQFCLGATLNIDYGILDIKHSAATLGQYKENTKGWAVGATFGAQFHASDALSIGLAYKTPITVTLTGDASMSGAGLLGFTTTSGLTRKAVLPMWLGAGISYKPMDKLRLAFDVNWTNWKKLDMIDATLDNAGWNLALLSPQLKPVFDQTLVLNWKDCIQVRAGIEYQLNPQWALRLGYMSDPTPSPLETMSILLPQIPYNIITVGAGYGCAKFSINAALEILMGKDQEVPLTGKMPGTHGMSLIVPSIQLTYNL